MQTQGSLQDTSLASLLQTMQSERSTGTLSIHNGSDIASLHFLFGHLFHATGPGGEGEEVVVQALTKRSGSFTFDPRAKLPAEETIKSSPADLIAEAERRGGEPIGPVAASSGIVDTLTPTEAWPAPTSPSPYPSFDLPPPEPHPMAGQIEPTPYFEAPPPEEVPQYQPPAPVEEPAYTAPPQWEPPVEAPAASAPETYAPSPFFEAPPPPAPQEPWPQEASTAPPGPIPAAVPPEVHPAAAEPQLPEPVYAPEPELPPQPDIAQAFAPPPPPTPAIDTWPPPTPVAPATSQPAPEILYPLPAGKPQYTGLKSAFVDFPKLLRTLRSDEHTGYVRIYGDITSGTLLFRGGTLLEAIWTSADGVVRGEAALQTSQRFMEGGQGRLDVVDLEANTATALAQLLNAQPLFTGLLGRFVDFDALLDYLSEERIDGSVIVAGAEEMGVIILHDGDVLGAYTESARDLDSSTTRVSALAREPRSRIEVRSGGEVGTIDVERVLTLI